MIRDVVLEFPPDWLVEVTVQRGGGFDRFGRPLPATQHTVPSCLIGEATSDELDQFSEVSSLDAVLLGPVAANIVNTDSIDSPASAFAPARSWRVAGHPLFSPLGTKVPLTLDP